MYVGGTISATTGVAHDTAVALVYCCRVSLPHFQMLGNEREQTLAKSPSLVPNPNIGCIVSLPWFGNTDFYRVSLSWNCWCKRWFGVRSRFRHPVRAGRTFDGGLFGNWRNVFLCVGCTVGDARVALSIKKIFAQCWWTWDRTSQKTRTREISVGWIVLAVRTFFFCLCHIQTSNISDPILSAHFVSRHLFSDTNQVRTLLLRYWDFFAFLHTCSGWRSVLFSLFLEFWYFEVIVILHKMVSIFF